MFISEESGKNFLKFLHYIKQLFNLRRNKKKKYNGKKFFVHCQIDTNVKNQMHKAVSIFSLTRKVVYIKRKKLLCKTVDIVT